MHELVKATVDQLINRDVNSNKYSFGHLLVIGGSEGMVGAPLLCAEAALRTGAGLITIASHPIIIDKLEKRVKEVMTLKIKSTDQVIDFIHDRKVTALVVGPGADEGLNILISEVLKKVRVPVLIDASSLQIYSGKFDGLKKLSKSVPVVLTPHAGEYKKLTQSSEFPAENKIIDFASDNGLVIVYKQHNTIVSNGKDKYRNDTGNPGLATAGSGDVLSGIIGSLLAQGFEIYQAGVAGVWIHGKAGDLAANEKTQPGMTASDIIQFIPEALKLA
jgi:hydroxyethylthiazole kinase-like uncharacterized protein yjeF